MSIFHKATPAPDTSSTKHRFWRGKKSGGNVQTKRKEHKGRTVDWRAKGAEKCAIATARLQERLSHFTYWFSYQLYTFTHPCSPFRRRAAKRSKEHSKLGATERRIHKEAIARSKSHEKRAKLLKKTIADDSEKAKLLQS